MLDVNFLIALFQPAHIHHHRAREWWRANRTHGWASCPLTQNGFIRILSQPKYPAPMSVDDALLSLQRATTSSEHAFWADDISLLDEQLIDRTRILGPKQLTDIYLLALAVKHGVRLATFDKAIPIAAVRSASPRIWPRSEPPPCRLGHSCGARGCAANVSTEANAQCCGMPVLLP
jgi:toxin-antitoxin system PIN domain toxin